MLKFIKSVNKLQWVVVVFVILAVVICVNRACTSDAESEYWKGK